MEFVSGRQRSSLIEQGYRYDVVDAVLAEQQNNPAAVVRAVNELSEWIRRPDWNTILPAYARCVRITRDQQAQYPLDPSLFQEPSELRLYQALLKATETPRQTSSVNDMLNAFLPMIPAVNEFFDTVLVMAEDAAIRGNRLGLLQRIAALTSGVADFSRLEGF